MFSVKGDTVLDPFLGTGTTTVAAIAAARSSIGIELDRGLEPLIESQVKGAAPLAGARIAERLENHFEFVRTRHASKGSFGYRNTPYGFPVVTRQEMDLFLSEPRAVEAISPASFEVEYPDGPDSRWLRDWEWFFGDGRAEPGGGAEPSGNPPRGQTLVQLDLL